MDATAVCKKKRDMFSALGILYSKSSTNIRRPIKHTYLDVKANIVDSGRLGKPGMPFGHAEWSTFPANTNLRFWLVISLQMLNSLKVVSTGIFFSQKTCQKSEGEFLNKLFLNVPSN